MPRLRRAIEHVVRPIAPAVAGGMIVGALGIGVVSRLAMRLLALTSDADGLTTDDGFVVGRFTLAGTVSLLLVGAFLGAFAGVLSDAVGAVAPTGRLRVGPGLVLGATVGGALVIHTDGVDFTVLEPSWLAIALFIVVPALIGGALVPVVDRLHRPEGAFNRLPLPVRSVFVLPLVLPPVLVAAAFTGVVRGVVSLWPGLTVPAGRLVMAAIALSGGAHLVSKSITVI